MKKKQEAFEILADVALSFRDGTKPPPKPEVKLSELKTHTKWAIIERNLRVWFDNIKVFMPETIQKMGEQWAWDKFISLFDIGILSHQMITKGKSSGQLEMTVWNGNEYIRCSDLIVPDQELMNVSAGDDCILGNDENFS